MQEDENLCKVETKDGDLYLFTRRFREDRCGFELSITDGSSMWNAKVAENMLEEMAQKVEMTTKEYTSQTLNALTANSAATDTFIYQAIQNESTLELNWKKQLDDGVKFQLGSITLSSIEENKILMKKILDFAIRKVDKYKDTISNMKCETEQLARERDNAISRLDKCIAGKEEMEVDLFQKFVTVLNDKKAKIRRLHETIERQSKEPRLPSNSKLAEEHITTAQTRDDDTDVETDESHDYESKDTIEEKTTTSSNIGSCLFQDEEDTAPVTKRRRKQPGRQSARTPSKPVLPEVKTSVKRTTSNASSTSTNSNESKQSGSSARRTRRKKALSTFPDDVEDLFGDMA